MPGGTTGEGALRGDDELAGVVRSTAAAVRGRPIPALERGVAERLAERGASYGATVHGPLAPVAAVTAG